MKDSTEVEKFTRLASEWWDTRGSFKVLHKINPIRLKYIVSTIRNEFKLPMDTPMSNISILDIGCGGGLVSLPLSRLGAQVTAIDAGEANINVARNQAILEGLDIEFIMGTSNELSATSRAYDVIICLEVIEHVDNPESLINDISALLKPEGIAIISTINRNLKAKLLTIALAEYILQWVPKGTHDYNKYLLPAEIRNYGQRHSLKTKELKGLEFDLLTRSWLLSDRIDVNYFITLQKNL